MQISLDGLSRKRATFVALERDRLPFWNVWRDLASYLLPTRYNWLMTAQERINNLRNSLILDSTGTRAARILAAGMMNGITSPARPWFKLRVEGFDQDLSSAARQWLDEVERRMLVVMAQSNFYQALAVAYLDLVIFGTACILIYDDEDKVIHCHNNALGEFYLMIDKNKRVCGIGRVLDYTSYQVMQEFGEENCSDQVRSDNVLGGPRLQSPIKVRHLIEPNTLDADHIPGPFYYREYYWEESGSTQTVDGVRILRKRGYVDFPGICPRWELAGNDAYGTSPGMDALPDIIQLQHETKAKAKALDKALDPPMLADISLQHKPTAMLPRSVTYVPRLDASNGMRPAYQVTPPIQEITGDIREIQQRIRDTFFNFLFNPVSQLDTVRSATEIAAIDDEKLVLVGPVLERFDNEGLDPSIHRIYSIMVRRKLIPPPPPEIASRNLSLQYISILHAAQSAVGTAPTERFLQFIGSLSGVFPEARMVPNIPQTLLDYASDLGVKSKNVHSLDEITAAIQNQNQQDAQNQQQANALGAAKSAQVLSQADVGGGANALEKILGN